MTAPPPALRNPPALRVSPRPRRRACRASAEPRLRPPRRAFAAFAAGLLSARPVCAQPRPAARVETGCPGHARPRFARFWLPTAAGDAAASPHPSPTRHAPLQRYSTAIQHSARIHEPASRLGLGISAGPHRQATAYPAALGQRRISRPGRVRCLPGRVRATTPSSDTAASARPAGRQRAYRAIRAAHSSQACRHHRLRTR